MFIGGLLRETFEDTLVPMLEDCGMIYDLRIMTNASDGTNKGFAFCIFSDQSGAKACVTRVSCFLLEALFLQYWYLLRAHHHIYTSLISKIYYATFSKKTGYDMVIIHVVLQHFNITKN